jgi:aspartate-semialdehyde dehydrogenase
MITTSGEKPMKTIKIKVTCETGFVTATHTDELEVEVEETATPEEIEAILEDETKEWAMNKIEFWHEVIG